MKLLLGWIRTFSCVSGGGKGRLLWLMTLSRLQRIFKVIQDLAPACILRDLGLTHKARRGLNQQEPYFKEQMAVSNQQSKWPAVNSPSSPRRHNRYICYLVKHNPGLFPFLCTVLSLRWALAGTISFISQCNFQALYRLVPRRAATHQDTWLPLYGAIDVALLEQFSTEKPEWSL